MNLIGRKKNYRRINDHMIHIEGSLLRQLILWIKRNSRHRQRKDFSKVKNKKLENADFEYSCQKKRKNSYPR